MPAAVDLLAQPRRRERVRRRIRRTVLARRRPLAALCAAIAVLGILRSVHPASPTTVAVVVAAHDLASGTRLTAADLEVRRYPASVVPAGAHVEAVGRTLAGPVRAGEPITDVRLVGASLLAGYPGLVAMPVRVADADAVSLLRAGDHVDLLAADPRHSTASYVAVDAPVLSLPTPTSASDSQNSGRLVVLAVAPSDVDPIAGAAATDLLSVVISR